MVSSHSGRRPSATPAASAATSWLKSSTVGPSPPFTITASARPAAASKAARSSARSSPTVVSRRIGSPTLARRRLSRAEIGVDGLPAQHLVAGADHLDAQTLRSSRCLGEIAIRRVCCKCASGLKPLRRESRTAFRPVNYPWRAGDQAPVAGLPAAGEAHGSGLLQDRALLPVWRYPRRRNRWSFRPESALWQ